MRRSLAAIVGGWILLLCAPLSAQDAVLGQMYGNGVHAYFSQDYVKAHQYLTTAIDAHTQDPRCYYFRGLVDNKLGRPQEAELDFKEGAKLENNVDMARSYGVARSLERIQGPERAELEQFRLEARAAILKKSEEQDRVRYDKTKKETDQFLIQESKVAPAEKVDAPPAAKANVDPFNPGGEVKKPDAPAEKPAEPTAEKPADKTPETPAELPKTADKPAAPADKSAPKAGDADPFGATPAAPEKPADKAPEKPAAKAEKPDAADPFAAPPAGASPATPAEKPKEADKPKEDPADPFGAGAAPAKKDDAPPPAAKKEDAPAAPAADKKADADKAADPFKEEPEKKDAGAAAKPEPKPDAPKEPAKDAKPADNADPFK